MNEQNVYIVDDDEAVRDSIQLLLDSVGLSCTTFSNAKEFLDVYTPALSGCIVLDVRMARMSGLVLQQRLNELGCRLPIIFITGHGDVQMAVQALKNGAYDFIQKPFHKDSLLDCINNALEKDAEKRTESDEHERISTRIKLLTKREKEVLGLLIEGKSSKFIGKELDISPRTVDVHRQNILNKLEAKTITSLVRVLSTIPDLVY